MANHVRQQIREALATLLTGLSTTGAKVYQSRLTPLQAAELPALLIATNNEGIEALSVISNPLLERSLTITVTAVAKAVSNLDDTLDTIIKEVEQAINASATANTLNGLIKELTFKEVEIEMNAQAEMPTGQAMMTFIASYYTQAATPDISI
jgi:hypothetical protein